MEAYSSKLWGKFSAVILVIMLILATMDMYMNTERVIYDVGPALGLLSTGYFILDGVNYLSYFRLCERSD